MSKQYGSMDQYDLLPVVISVKPSFTKPSLISFIILRNGTLCSSVFVADSKRHSMFSEINLNKHTNKWIYREAKKD